MRSFRLEGRADIVGMGFRVADIVLQESARSPKSEQGHRSREMPGNVFIPQNCKIRARPVRNPDCAILAKILEPETEAWAKVFVEPRHWTQCEEEQPPHDKIRAVSGRSKHGLAPDLVKLVDGRGDTAFLVDDLTNPVQNLGQAVPETRTIVFALAARFPGKRNEVGAIPDNILKDA